MEGRPSCLQRPGVPAPSWQLGCWRRIPRAAFASRPSSETAGKTGEVIKRGRYGLLKTLWDFRSLKTAAACVWVLTGQWWRALQIYLTPHVLEQLHFRLKITAVNTYEVILCGMVLNHYRYLFLAPDVRSGKRLDGYAVTQGQTNYIPIPRWQQW